MIQNVFIAFLSAFLLLGCALTPEQSRIREDNDVLRQNNWILCQKLYKVTNRATVHVGHTHNQIMTPLTRSEAVRSDLFANNCKKALKEYWETLEN